MLKFLLQYVPIAALATLISSFIAPVCRGQPVLPVTIPLWEDTPPPAARGMEADDVPSLTLYHASERSRTGAAVVVCPGGGYHALAMGHEGHDVAAWLNKIGISTFVLEYRRAPKYAHPVPLMDAQRAIRLVRSSAKEWEIDPRRIGILGFSAGGHLASSAGTHFDTGVPESPDPVERVSSRPDFMILAYPVISFVTEYTHEGSKRNLLGEHPDDRLVSEMSSELQVSPETPPTFLVHTSEDTGVPPQNSILFYMALHRAGVPAEMHIFEKGRHGLGLAPHAPAFSRWPDLAETWLQARGVLGREGSN